MSQKKSVAIIGASTNREKYGNKALRAYAQRGYDVYPVHPSAAEVEGHAAYASVLDLPVTPDEASFYVPPSVGLGVMDEVASRGIRRVWLNPGAESDEIIQKAETLGIEAIVACSIVGLELSPSEF